MDKTFNSQEAAAIGGVDEELLGALRKHGYFGKEMAKQKEDQVEFTLDDLAILDVVNVAIPFCGWDLTLKVVSAAYKAKDKGCVSRGRKRFTILVVQRICEEDESLSVTTKWIEPIAAKPAATPDRLSINMELLWTNVKARAAGFERAQLLARLEEIDAG